MRPAAARTLVSCVALCLLLGLLLGLLLSGCGGSEEDGQTNGQATGTAPETRETLEELWRAPGDDVAVIPGTSDHVPGDVRVSFLVTDAQGQLVTLPTARVWVAHALEERPFLESTAKLERVVVPGGDEADSTHMYVAHLRLPKAGTYWFLAEPDGGPTEVQALGNVVVAKSSNVPDVGDPAPASETPTLSSVGGDAARITTRTPPDVTLLRHSVAESLRAGRPFVVTFSTPKFCASRVCGPVVEVVEEVARRLEDTDLRFIHVEVYEDNDPARGFNRWVREWRLPTEPWTFVVGADGRIAARFEGAVSVRELEEAAQEVTSS